MKHIIVFEQKKFLLERIRKVVDFELCKLYEATSPLALEHYLGNDLIKVDMIIAELNFSDNQEVEMITNYLYLYPETKLIIFTSDNSKQAFLDSIKVGAKDYIIHTLSDEEIKKRIDQHLNANQELMIPTHLILNLNKYISGELIKASKGQYGLTIAFSSVLNEKSMHILKEDTSRIANYFSANYWDTDSIAIYGYNHLLSFFPFCTKDMVALLDEKLQHLFAQFKMMNMDLAKCTLHNTYVTFPDEGLTVNDIIKIVRKKIEISAKQISTQKKTAL